jgi:hypothetical protein
MIRFILCSIALGFLPSCSTTGGGGVGESCCLVEPGRPSLLMPNSKACKAALEQWVNKNARHLSTSGGAKPRFVLMYVGKDQRIKDQMPLTDQASPTAPHKLTEREVSDLRACFRGGKTVKVDWASKRVVP